MVEYLDKVGLTHLWSKIKAYFNSTFAGSRQYVGTCTSAANAQNKVGTVDSSFTLVKGVIVSLKFSYTNTFSATEDSSITLNVNNTGAKQIYYNTSDANTGTNTTIYGIKDVYTSYIYNGTQWVWIGRNVDSNTTYSAMSASEITTGTSTKARSISAKVLNNWLNSKNYLTSIPDFITDTEMDNVLE